MAAVPTQGGRESDRVGRLGDGAVPDRQHVVRATRKLHVRQKHLSSSEALATSTREVYSPGELKFQWHFGSFSSLPLFINPTVCRLLVKQDGALYDAFRGWYRQAVSVGCLLSRNLLFFFFFSPVCFLAAILKQAVRLTQRGAQ